ncbi:SDR family NAD(P)-dependent oxidoreductase [Phaeovulum sp. NW3]|uniref:SDR family NAD(P)-dependent oxidoreductase n=1 Tax=Phaeovulum sp. NW3 TaxID=2934933 RepID=UPI002022153F|nr:SDR family NAD(P)-dependent oxidoreductase [Phaeovulum sp. NW3]MCL7465640.1 SDR family NAD(P)-dependent oxidoreductase [Phaeovulum sp. NW3]
MRKTEQAATGGRNGGAGMKALVIGDTGGIGAAVAAELARRGGAVTGLSRHRDGFDVTDEASVADHMGRLAGPYDLIFVATGALGVPEKAIRALDPGALQAQFAVNAIGPALVLKHAVRLLSRNRRAVFAVLSARVGSIGDNRLGGWYSYRAAKAALNQLMRTGAVELARTHRQAVVACLHPGTVDTPFTAGYGHYKLPPAESAARLLAVLDGLGPADSGSFRDHTGAVVEW